MLTFGYSSNQTANCELLRFANACCKHGNQVSLFAKQKNGLKIDQEKNTGTRHTGLLFIDSHATIKWNKRL